MFVPLKCWFRFKELELAEFGEKALGDTTTSDTTLVLPTEKYRRKCTGGMKSHEFTRSIFTRFYFIIYLNFIHSTCIGPD